MKVKKRRSMMGSDSESDELEVSIVDENGVPIPPAPPAIDHRGRLHRNLHRGSYTVKTPPQCSSSDSDEWNIGPEGRRGEKRKLRAAAEAALKNASPRAKNNTVTKIKLKMRAKDDTEMENAFNFKEYVPSGRFASHTKSSVNRLNATQDYMIDLVMDGGHPSLTKKKAPPVKKTGSIEFDED